MNNKKFIANRKLAVSISFDVVRIDVICGDNYEAQVLYDDIIERMKSGEGITLRVPPAISRD
jgi:hypothetical protein